MVSKWLTKQLQILKPFPSSAIKNRYDFLDYINELNIQEDEVM